MRCDFGRDDILRLGYHYEGYRGLSHGQRPCAPCGQCCARLRAYPVPHRARVASLLITDAIRMVIVCMQHLNEGCRYITDLGRLAVTQWRCPCFHHLPAPCHPPLPGPMHDLVLASSCRVGVPLGRTAAVMFRRFWRALVLYPDYVRDQGAPHHCAPGTWKCGCAVRIYLVHGLSTSPEFGILTSATPGSK